MSAAEILMSLEIGLIYGIVAIGIYLTFRVIDFPDLTCDGSFALGAALSAIAIKNGANPIIALILSLIAGGFAGLLTGILNTVLKVTELLSGILVAFMLYSINLKVMGGVPNISLLNCITIFNNHNSLFVLCLISICFCILCGYLLTTDFGLSLRSIGQNKTLSINSGIQIKKMTITGLVISNALIGFGGALFGQHQEVVDISQGIGTVIVGLAAVMIGEKIFPFRSIWILISSCLVGSVLYRIFVAIALHSEILGLETQDLNLITGLLVIAVMVTPKMRFKKC